MHRILFSLIRCLRVVVVFVLLFERLSAFASPSSAMYRLNLTQFKMNILAYVNSFSRGWIWFFFFFSSNFYSHSLSVSLSRWNENIKVVADESLIKHNVSIIEFSIQLISNFTCNTSLDSVIRMGCFLVFLFQILFSTQ